MSELIIYGYPASTFVRTVRMACVEKGVVCQLDAFESLEFRSAEHYEMHPFGKMPIMRHDDSVLFETLAICRYIDSAFEGPRLTPEKMFDRCLMDQWISVINDELYTCLVRKWILPVLRNAELSEQDTPQAAAKARDALASVDRRLDGGHFLAGESVSLADLFMAPLLAYALQLNPDILSGMDKLAEVWAEISSRESFARTMP